jgi:hypothetical protein
MRVLVCGGRNYTDFPTVYDVLDEIDRKRRITHVITGGAAGADQFATAPATGVPGRVGRPRQEGRPHPQPAHARRGQA